jgi:Putative transposase
LKYLARYTHRAALSNHRLLELEGGEVHFRWTDYAAGGRWRTMTLSAVEFVRRFVMHVLPAGFVRIRHYGLLANRHRREKLALCRELLGAAASEVEDVGSMPRREGSDPVTPTRACPVCGAGRLVVIAELPAMDVAGVAAGRAEREAIFDTS